MGNETRLRAYIKKYWKFSLAFMLYMYFFLTAELSFTDVAGMAFGEKAGMTFYGLYSLAAAVGFFVFGLTLPLVKSTGKRRRGLFVLGAVGTGCTLLMPFVSGYLIGIFSLAAMLIAGYIGGAFLYSAAVTLRDKSICGMLFAIPVAAANLLQYAIGFIEPLFGDALFIVTCVFIAALLAVSVILLLIYCSGASATAVPRIAKKSEAKKHLTVALVSCVIISCLYGLMDGIIMKLSVGQALDVWGWVRLLTVPGILCAAWFADFRNGRYFQFATLVAMIAGVLSVLLWHTAETYNIALGCVYFFFSFMSLYNIVSFVHMANDTDNPAFWASVGRGSRYAVGGVVALAGSFVFTKMNLIAVMIIYIVLLIALSGVVYFRGKLLAAPLETAGANTNTSSQTFDSFVAAYGFTERETELMRLLLSGKPASAIAEEMFVTVGTIHKYTSAMMAKTGTKSRPELMAIFKG